jgi:hypothetical protein
LEIKAGPLAGQKIPVPSGKTLLIGRALDRAHFAVPHDALMSGLHFAVITGSQSYRIVDRMSTNGTFLNGARVQEAVLAAGDEIRSGQTVFKVRMVPDNHLLADLSGAVPLGPTPSLLTGTRAAAPAPVSPPQLSDKSPIPTTPRERFLTMLGREFQPLFAVLDAARDPNIFKFLVESEDEFQSLYEGPEGSALAHFAPYLVRLKPDSALLEKLVFVGWGRSWGVYLTCGSEFQELRHHIRRFLKVKMPDQKEFYFRYYDPRVLRLFLPTCTPEETNAFFGPVTGYLVEDEAPEGLLQFTNLGRGAQKAMLC